MEWRLHLTEDMYEDEKLYVLVVGIDVRRPVALGPFTRDEVEYAAQDYYGTAITGASAAGAFLIAELLPGDLAAIDHQHAAHVRGLMLHDD